MEGRVCIVTGANTGIGLETARGLAERGATVAMTSRDEERGRAAAEDVRSSTGNDDVHLVPLDLSSLASVWGAADELRDRFDAIHVLVNNAGLILSERRTTEDGFEATLGINHLGHFLLTHLLLDRLCAGRPSRVVNVSSDAHHQSSGLRFDDLMWETRSYSGFAAYCDSKLANILYTRELARRLEGQGVVAHALHPGVVRSGFAMDGDVRGPFRWAIGLARPFFIGPKRGAKTSLHVATSDGAGERTGEYWSKSRVARPSRAARDDDAARRLWETSEQLLGLT